MEKAYSKTQWNNDLEPALEADNLNKIENGIDTIDNRVVAINTIEDTVSNYFYNSATNRYESSGIAVPTDVKEYAKTANDNVVKSIQGVNKSLESINQINGDLHDVEFLGWEVPSECPIQNSFDGKTFTQRVGRVDLGTLDWNYQYGNFRTSSMQGIIYAESNDKSANAYIEGYTVVPDNAFSGNKKISINTAGNIYITNSDYTNASTFKSAMSEKYLYFELATPIIHKAGSEAVSQINESLNALEFNGWTIPNELKLSANKVNRVKIADLNWNRAQSGSFYFYTTSISDFVGSHGANVIENIHIDGYTTIGNTITANQLTNMSVSGSGTTRDKLIVLRNDSFADINAIKSSDSYIYYELENAKTLVKGKEAVSEIKAELDNKQVTPTNKDSIVKNEVTYRNGNVIDSFFTIDGSVDTTKVVMNLPKPQVSNSVMGTINSSSTPFAVSADTSVFLSANGNVTIQTTGTKTIKGICHLMYITKE